MQHFDFFPASLALNFIVNDIIRSFSRAQEKESISRRSNGTLLKIDKRRFVFLNLVLRTEETCLLIPRLPSLTFLASQRKTYPLSSMTMFLLQHVATWALRI